MHKFQIEKFNPGMAANHASILILGRSGQRYPILHELLPDLLRGKLGFVVTLRPEVFSRDFPPNRIWKPKKMPKLLEYILLRCHLKKYGLLYQDIVVIFDTHAEIQSECWRKMVLNGRYYGVTTIACRPSIQDLPPDLRNNFDWILCASTPNLQAEKALTNCFATKSLEMFQRIFAACTEKPGGLLVIDQNKIETKYYWWATTNRNITTSEPDKNLHLTYEKAAYRITFQGYVSKGKITRIVIDVQLLS